MASKLNVTPELTKKVAGLARLKLTDDEVTRFTAQLTQVLGYVDALQEIDAKGIEPMTHVLENALPMREDTVREFPRDAAGKPKVLKDAPDTLYDGFKVPPIL